MMASNNSRKRESLFEGFYAFAIEEVRNEKKGFLRFAFPRGKSHIEGMSGGVNTLIDFAFPRLQHLKSTTYMKPQSYVFTVTLQDGSRLYGFCRQLLSPGIGNRYDVGKRFPEVLCIMSKTFEADLFFPVLAILHIRRLLNPESVEPFLRNFHEPNLCPAFGTEFRINSHSCGLMLRYRFKRPRNLDRGNPVHLFNHLTPKILLYTMGAVMCERRVIFIAQSEETLSSCIHGVCALMYPFDWCWIFIPILPEKLLQYVAAPSPYLIGVLRSHLNEVKAQPLGDVVFVDLDKNEINNTAKNDPIRPFGIIPDTKPTNKGAKELRVSEQFASEVFSVYNKYRKGNLHIEQSIKVIWLSLHLYLFGYLTRFSEGAATQKINKEKFLKSVYDPYILHFLQSFQHTQMFDTFVQQRFETLRIRASNPRSFDNLHNHDTEVLGASLFDQSLSVIRGDFSLTEIKKTLSDKRLIRPRSYGNDTRTLTRASDSLSGGSVVKEERIFPRFAELAGSSYNANDSVVIMDVIWSKLKTCSGRNWKAGYNALQLACFLASAGSETTLASLYEHFSEIYRLMNFRTDALGVSKDASHRVQTAARRLYRIINDVELLKHLRGPDGNLLVSGHKLKHRENEGKSIARAAKSWKHLAGMSSNMVPFPGFDQIHNALDPREFCRTIPTCSASLAALKKGEHPILVTSVGTADLLGINSFSPQQRAYTPSRTPPPPPPPKQIHIHAVAHPSGPPPPPEEAEKQLLGHVPPPPPPKKAEEQASMLTARVPPPPPVVAATKLHSVAAPVRGPPPPPSKAEEKLLSVHVPTPFLPSNSTKEQPLNHAVPPRPTSASKILETKSNFSFQSQSRLRPPIPQKRPDIGKWNGQLKNSNVQSTTSHLPGPGPRIRTESAQSAPSPRIRTPSPVPMVDVDEEAEIKEAIAATKVQVRPPAPNSRKKRRPPPPALNS